MDHYDDVKNADSQAKNHPRASVLTLEDIMGKVAVSRDIREHRRRTLLSGIRTVARAIGKEPKDILAQPAALQRELAGANYRKAGLTHLRFINARSLTRSALRLAGVKCLPGRQANSEFTPAWAKLRGRCSLNMRIGLSRFLNHCCAHGVEPDGVNAEVMKAFENEILHGLMKNGHKVYRETCRLWDKAAETVEGWPAFKVGVATAIKGYSRPWTDYPDSLLVNVEKHLNKGACQDVLSDDYAPPVREATTRGRRRSLRLMAHALAESGVPLSAITDLAVFVVPDNAKAILRFFLQRNEGNTNEGIYGHACLLRLIAKHWVKAHPEAIADLDRYCKKLSCKQKGMTPRNRERLRQFDDPANLRALLNLPGRLIRLAKQQDDGGTVRLCYAVYAAAIEVVLHAPLRIKNLGNLTLSENVIMPRQDRGGRIVIAVPPEDVKNSEPLEYELSPVATALLREYLRDYRPRISETQSDWLFPNARGEKRNISGFGHQISHIILRQTGLEVHPHLFRHLAVKLYQSVNPGDLESASRLLGHKTTATTARAYWEGKSTIAQRRFADLIDEKRNGISHQHSREISHDHE